MKRFSTFVYINMMTLLLFGVSCKKENSTETVQPLRITLAAYADEQPLIKQGIYTNASGERYNINLFRFYVSNIVLKGANGTPDYVQPESYHLVNLTSASTFSLTLPNVPDGVYSAVEWMLGVDSARNVSGVQTGALDPANGMFWTWNSGYVQFQLEGSMPDRTLDFLYHIGGFKGQFNPLHTQTIVFPQLYYRVQNKPAIVWLKCDVNEVFVNPLKWSIYAKPQVTTEDGDSKMLANNYADMIRFDRIEH